MVSDPGTGPSSVSSALRPDCPNCGGRLGPPVSGEVHCYVECTRCRTRFELDDPELSDPGAPRG